MDSTHFFVIYYPKGSKNGQRGKHQPVAYAMFLIDGKWKMYVVWLWEKEPLQYGELKRLLGPVTHKMLSSQLKERERMSGLSEKNTFKFRQK
jgi:DNA-binding HxlR family transcriptional regulator